MGSDLPIFRSLLAQFPFQSTLPHGERHLEVQHGKIRKNFNPRSRMGSDFGANCQGISAENFNPRSRMGSDLLRAAAKLVALRFQSTLPHGERLDLRVKSQRVRKNFNPRSRMGSDSKLQYKFIVKTANIPQYLYFFEACKINYTTKYILVIKKTNILACEPPRDFMIACSSHFK